MSSFLTPLLSWLRPSPSRRPNSVRARLALEQLEGRSLPSTVTLAASVVEPHRLAEAHHHHPMAVHHHAHHRHHHDGAQGGEVQRQGQIVANLSGSTSTRDPSIDLSSGQALLHPQSSTTSSATSGGGGYYGSGGEGGGGEDGRHHGDHCGHDQGAENQLEANLTGAGGATGTAEFDLTANTFELKVANAAPNARLNVVVDNNTVATIATDAQGNGELELSQPGITPKGGSTLVVGDINNGGLSGTLASNAENKADAELQVDLAPPVGGTGSGTAEFKQHDQQRLEVKVRDLAANSTFTVTVDQTVVGQLTTDHNGRGELRLDSTTIGIKNGSVLTVGDIANPVLQGTFTSSGGGD
jgi:hypothetical protein